MERALYKKLMKLICGLSEKDKELIKKAFLFAKNAHQGQKRKTGQDYITHPLKVSVMLAERKFDVETIVSAILHDVIEVTAVEYDDIVNNFNPNVAEIVDGVTKISNIKNKERTLNFSHDDEFIFMVDNYRKLLIATAKDVRVIIVKIFDRIHNMETMDWIEENKREFYAKEAIEIYAQIAERIGLSEAKIALENLAFKYAYPKEYDKFILIKRKSPSLNNEFVNQTIQIIKQLLINNKVKYFDIYGRIKHDFSLYKKLYNKYSFNLDSVFDLYAFRIIVFSIKDCYQSLGLIHSYFDPIPGKIYDYIACPKENGYQSIHTTVKDQKGQIFEIQIRTDKMHEVAEHGLAAHWHYKNLFNSKNENLINQIALEWQVELASLLQEKNHTKFLDNLKNELFSEKIFVFTPKGEIIKLPHGSTPVDFAFSIHTKIGLNCGGARINGRIMPISTVLNNSDIVEIIISNRARPSIDWLRFVKTSSAKQKIRQYLREANRDNLILDGKLYLHSFIDEFKLKSLDQRTLNQRIKDSRLPYNSLNDALIALAEKDLPKIALLKTLYPNFNNDQKNKLVIYKEKTGIDSLAGIKYGYAGCCKPKQTDNIIGYVTNKHIIKIHNLSCRFVKKANKNRLIDI